MLEAGFDRVDYVAIRDAATLVPLRDFGPARTAAARHHGAAYRQCGTLEGRAVLIGADDERTTCLEHVIVKRWRALGAIPNENVDFVSRLLKVRFDEDSRCVFLALFADRDRTSWFSAGPFSNRFHERSVPSLGISMRNPYRHRHRGITLSRIRRRARDSYVVAVVLSVNSLRPPEAALSTADRGRMNVLRALRIAAVPGEQVIAYDDRAGE
jgi:hypothetical protein